MDELQERAEIDALYEEQLRDDTEYVVPQFRDTIPIEALDNILGLTPDGETISFQRHEKGSILIGAAPWHGSASGYVNHKCRCRPCKDAQAARVRRQRLQRKEREAAE